MKKRFLALILALMMAVPTAIPGIAEDNLPDQVITNDIAFIADGVDDLVDDRETDLPAEDDWIAEPVLPEGEAQQDEETPAADVADEQRPEDDGAAADTADNPEAVPEADAPQENDADAPAAEAPSDETAEPSDEPAQPAEAEPADDAQSAEAEPANDAQPVEDAPAADAPADEAVSEAPVAVEAVEPAVEEALDLDAEDMTEQEIVLEGLELSTSRDAAYGSVGTPIPETDLTWSLDENGTLTISGTGNMPNWPKDNEVPWYNDANDIKEIVIESGVTSIGDFAFANCTYTGTSGVTVTIANTVTTIGYAAFQGSTGISTITIPSSVTEIFGEVFSGCRNLNNVTIQSGVTSIGAQAFKDCMSLRSIELPGTLTSIGDNAFQGCTNLGIDTNKNAIPIVIPDSVQSLGEGVFSDCTELVSVKLSANLTEIPGKTFYMCNHLTENPENPIIPEKVTSIGDQAFVGCNELRKLYIPGAVTAITGHTFATGTYPSELTEITFGGTEEKWKDIQGDGKSTIPSTAKIYFTHAHDGVTFTGVDDLSQITAEGNYYLTKDVKLTSTWNVPAYDIKLCLYGHNIKAEGSFAAITVGSGATLTLYNCVNAGTISHGSGEGVGVSVSGGTFTMQGGSITKNTVGVEKDAAEGGSVVINGGAIQNNMGFGVKADQIELSGGPAIDTVSISGKIIISNALTYTSAISVKKSANTDEAFTSRWTEKMEAADPAIYFTSGDAQYMVYKPEGGNELFIGLKVTGVTVSPETLALSTEESDKTGQLTAEVQPADAVNKAVTWSTSDADVATVDENGLVTAVANGTATITATTVDGGMTDTCIVTVGNLHKHNGIIFQPWESKNSLPSQPGNWYLTEDVNIREIGKNYKWIVPEGDVNLCLNGKTIFLQDTLIEVPSGAKLNLYDDGNGTITELYMGDLTRARVCVTGGTFNLHSGTISGNESSPRRAPGVDVSAGEFNMSGGSIEKTGYSNMAGGVYVHGGTFTMSGGTIKESYSCLVGGVYLESGVFNMTGGSITGMRRKSNHTFSCNVCGVYINGGTFNLSGGSITDNGNDNTSGHGGVYLEKGTFNLSGNPDISNNTVKGRTENVYLAADKKITVTDNLDVDNPIGVTMETPGVFTSGLKDNGTASKFKSDDSDYSVYTNGDGEAVLLGKKVKYWNTPEEKEAEAAVDGYVFNGTSSLGIEGKETWYAVAGNVTISGLNPYQQAPGIDKRLPIRGTVNLILCDGAKLTAGQGLEVLTGTTLRIWAQTKGTGELAAGSKDREGTGHQWYGAGIGGDNGSMGTGTVFDPGSGTIVINGGKIQAWGGLHSAGIGSGQNVSGGTPGNPGAITINGGKVYAEGFWGGAGIGGGLSSTGGQVSINGGTVVAVSGEQNTRAIGAGKDSSDNGSLNLYKTATVFAGKSADNNDRIKETGDYDRVNACMDKKYARIIPCGTDNNPHVLNRKTGKCDYCKADVGLLKITLTVTDPDDGGMLSAKVGDETAAYSQSLYACKGETVHLLPSPKTGWRIKLITAKDADNKDYRVSTENTFSMPEKAVTVSATFEMIPAEAAVITTQPTDPAPLTYGYTQGSTLTVAAKSLDGHTFSYQWYDGDKKPIENATGESFEVPTSLNAGDHEYYCVVTAKRNDNGDTKSTTSNTATVTVNPKGVTLTANSRETDVYDGTVKTVTGYTCSVNGVEFENVSASGSATDAGTYDVTFSGVALNETRDTTGNYVVDEVKNGTLTIKPIEDQVTVSIAGKTDAAVYDGKAHSVEGYTVTIDNPLYREEDFSITGRAAATQINVGRTAMGLTASQFRNESANFTNVLFKIETDGYQEIAPVETQVTVTVTGKTDAAVYDGKAHSVEGYTVTIDNPLYREGDFSFNGRAAATQTNVGRTAMGLTASQFKNDSANFTNVVFKVDADGYQEIKPAAITVTAEAKTKEEGEADPVLTYTVAGLVGTDKLTGALTRDPGEAPGTYAIKQGSLAATENYILNFVGAPLNIVAKPETQEVADYTLLAVMKPSGKTVMKLSWTPVQDAEGYDVFFKSCDGKYDYPIAQTTTGNGATSCRISGLKKGRAYKGYVMAWKTAQGVKTYIGNPSPIFHAITGGYTRRLANARSVTVKKRSVRLKTGKTSTIKASVRSVKAGRKVLAHTKALRYFSSDRNVATVSSKGRITARGVGSCTIYVVANNGVYASVKVTVE